MTETGSVTGPRPSPTGPGPKAAGPGCPSILQHHCPPGRPGGGGRGRLPVPNPQLSFADIAELALCGCPAGSRLADFLAQVIHRPEPPKKTWRLTRGG